MYTKIYLYIHRYEKYKILKPIISIQIHKNVQTGSALAQKMMRKFSGDDKVKYDELGKGFGPKAAL